MCNKATLTVVSQDEQLKVDVSVVLVQWKIPALGFKKAVYVVTTLT